MWSHPRIRVLVRGDVCDRVSAAARLGRSRRCGSPCRHRGRSSLFPEAGSCPVGKSRSFLCPLIEDGQRSEVRRFPFLPRHAVTLREDERSEQACADEDSDLSSCIALHAETKVAVEQALLQIGLRENWSPTPLAICDNFWCLSAHALRSDGQRILPWRC